MLKPATSGKYSEIIEKIFLALFVISIFSTFIFWWSGLSNKNALDEETEQKFAEILNENFKPGDIVFTENDWDLDFLKGLKSGILPIILDLKNATEKSILQMKNGDERVFLLLKSEQSHEKYVKKLNLKVIEKFKAGKGEVILAETLFKIFIARNQKQRPIIEFFINFTKFSVMVFRLLFIE